jgi:hypothetical protein
MTETNSELHLHEQILLLALRDDAGTVESRAGMFTFAMGGAILAELLLAGCISIDASKRKLVDLIEVRPQRDPVLDEALGLISSARRRRSAANWVARLAQIKRLRHRVAEGLCRRGVLKDAEDKILLLFTRKIYPTIDPEPEQQLIESLRRAIFEDTDEIDPRVCIVAALANGTGLLRAHFDRKELKRRKRRLERITSGDLVGGATKHAVEAVEAAQVAVMAAVLAATMVTTIAGSQ